MALDNVTSQRQAGSPEPCTTSAQWRLARSNASLVPAFCAIDASLLAAKWFPSFVMCFFSWLSSCFIAYFQGLQSHKMEALMG